MNVPHPYSSPLGAVVRGMTAATVGTLAMDAVWYSRYRREGGTSDFLAWETAEGLSDWDHAPVPARVGRRLIEAFLQRPLPATGVRTLTNVMHWGYGLTWGALYGLIVGSTRRRSPLLGPLFGATVFSADYAILPLGGFYKPIWEYDAKTVWKDLSAHLVFGSATGIVFWLLSRV
ncbi:MAG TPA: hypothetical protein VET65_06700 [Candidatus Limnocylindrales bacterium]|nr:hypothetical protein [Candidatus Limnocylindrales bacterium]